MARMLRKDSWGFYSCCSHCDRKKKIRKTADRERHHARQAEKRQWRKDQT